MKNKMSNKIFLIFSLFTIITGISFISAFSVSSPYMENKQLNISLKSGITDLQFVLQNGGGATEDITIKVNILKGSEVMSLMDEDEFYLVSPGDKVPVNLRITLPEKAKEGDSYDIVLSFMEATQGQSGEFGFGTAQEHRFKIILIKEITERERWIKQVAVYLIVGILLVLIIISDTLIKRKKKKNKRK